jgi:hypothetical protein
MITTNQLASTLNESTSVFKKQLIALILGADFSDAQYMTTAVVGEGGTYVTGSGVIGDIVQGFKAEFEALGNTTFDPNEILARKHKINVKITPADIYGKWIAFLAAENKKASEMPITLYIIEQLLKPKIQENRQKLLAKGVYDAARLAEFGYSVDGYLKLIADGVGNTGKMYKVPISLGAPTESNIVDYFEQFVDKLPADIDMMAGNIYCDPDLIKWYLRKDRELNGVMPSYKPEDLTIFATDKKLVGLKGMKGSRKVFFTPNNNFLRVININEGASNMFTKVDHYYVELSADWHESPGFEVPQLVFVATDGTVNASVGLAGGKTSLYFPS